MITLLEGLQFGIWLLGATFPLLVVLSGIGYLFYWKFRRDEVTLATLVRDLPEEDEEDYGEPDELQPVPSTVVRPPTILARREDEDGD